MTTTAEYDRIDAQGILRWLLTEHADVIISVAFQLAQGNPGMSAIIGNASRAWQAACLEAAPALPSATQTPDGDLLPYIALDDPRVLALAKARQQIEHENPFDVGIPTWDGLNEDDQEAALREARKWLHTVARAGLQVNR
jgi:hypothetical protein